MSAYIEKGLRSDRVRLEAQLRLNKRLRAILGTFVVVFASLSLVGVGMSVFGSGTDAVGGGVVLAFFSFLVTAALGGVLVIAVLPDLEEARGKIKNIDDELLEIALKDLGL